MPWVEFFEIKSTGDVTRVANFSTLSTLPVCVDSTLPLSHRNEEKRSEVATLGAPGLTGPAIEIACFG